MKQQEQGPSGAAYAAEGKEAARQDTRGAVGFTAAQAFDDCISEASKASKRQFDIAAGATDELQAAMHRVAANSLASFGRLLVGLKDLRLKGAAQ